MNNSVTDLNSTSSQFEIQASPEGSEESIFCRSWQSDQYQLVNIMVHGLGAHSGWFEPFASRLSNHNIKTYSFDLAGFANGQSRTPESWTTWVNDLRTVYRYVRKNEPKKAIVLTGNSMGALIVLSSMKELEEKPDAVALFSPGFGGYAKTFTLGYKLSAIATALFAPQKVIKLPYGAGDITSNETIRKQIESDPFASFSMKAGIGLQLLKLTKNALKNGRELPCPLFMATAGKELIVDNQLNEQFYKNVSSPHKQKEHFKDSYHDLIFEPSIEEMVGLFNQFLNSIDLV